MFSVVGDICQERQILQSLWLAEAAVSRWLFLIRRSFESCPESDIVYMRRERNAPLKETEVPGALPTIRSWCYRG